MKRLLLLLLLAIVTMAYTTLPYEEEQPIPIPASQQRPGDATKGYLYLTTGDYLKSGIPYSIFLFGIKKDTANYLGRDGINNTIPYDYTAVKAANGQLVVAPNCLQCHAQIFDGKLVMGLGNTGADFTVNRQATTLMLERFIKKDPAKYEAARSFLTSINAVSPQLITPSRGLNPADALAALLVAHRNAQTFAWSDSALMAPPTETIPTDVPAWWLLKKKAAMFYNGFGRGDFARFLMASNLLTVKDTAEAASVDAHFGDVLAFIKSINAPAYPKPIDSKLTAKGAVLFNSHCSRCHGTYGVNATYPNLLIPEDMIGTDSALYASNYSSPRFVDWFNKSWFTSGDHPAKLVPYRGYIAPPLDGIWITAPYLHNGSVPDLETLLDSHKRPKYWQRDFAKQDYNYETPGWHYKAMDAAHGSEVYNTTARGCGNYGHYFGDELTEAERKALIEYLKGL